jgi:hypothetical protein
LVPQPWAGHFCNPPLAGLAALGYCAADDYLAREIRR